MRTTRQAGAAVSAAALALLLAACGGGTPAATPTPTPSVTVTPDATTPAPEPSPSTEPEPAPGAEPTSGLADFTPPGTELTSDGDASAYVVSDVRVGEHDGYDRVVYELTGGEGTPGYRIGYVDQAVEDPSGQVREVDGDSILQVWLVGTTYPMEGGPQEFSQDLHPDDGDVEHVVRPLTFEGMTQSFIGLDDGPHPFRVLVLSDPARVVVDIQDVD